MRPVNPCDAQDEREAAGVDARPGSLLGRLDASSCPNCREAAAAFRRLFGHFQKFSETLDAMAALREQQRAVRPLYSTPEDWAAFAKEILKPRGNPCEP